MSNLASPKEKSTSILKSPAPPVRIELSSFVTPFGWIGLVGEDGVLSSIVFGHRSEKSVRLAASDKSASVKLCDWNPDLRNMFEAYTEGEFVNFSDVEIQLPRMTEFRRQIVMATRRLAYGETASYGDLAKTIGHPGAARAVGTVMSTNRFPIVIPCHRVLAAGGKLGGYSSPSGTELKAKLLEMESRAARTSTGWRRPR